MQIMPILRRAFSDQTSLLAACKNTALTELITYLFAKHIGLNQPRFFLGAKMLLTPAYPYIFAYTLTLIPKHPYVGRAFSTNVQKLASDFLTKNLHVIVYNCIIYLLARKTNINLITFLALKGISSLLSPLSSSINDLINWSFTKALTPNSTSSSLIK